MINDDSKMSLEDAALAHFGKKGMKWGVRKVYQVSEAQTKAAKAVGRTAAKGAHKVVVGSPDKSGVTRRDVRRANRKDTKQMVRSLEDWHDGPGKVRDADIHAARASLRQASRDYKDAKATYKSQKAVIGKNAAKITLNQAGNQRFKTEYKAATDTRLEKGVRVTIEVGAAVAKGLSDGKKENNAQADTNGK